MKGECTVLLLIGLFLTMRGFEAMPVRTRVGVPWALLHWLSSIPTKTKIFPGFCIFMKTQTSS